MSPWAGRGPWHMTGIIDIYIFRGPDWTLVTRPRISSSGPASTCGPLQWSWKKNGLCGLASVHVSIWEMRNVYCCLVMFWTAINLQYSNICVCLKPNDMIIISERFVKSLKAKRKWLSLLWIRTGTNEYCLYWFILCLLYFINRKNLLSKNIRRNVMY